MADRALIFEAFASRPRPSADRIIRPTVRGEEGDRLRDLLAPKTPAELTASELRSVVEGNLWMLGPEAFLYFLPAFLNASLHSYGSVSVFASELIGALTEPSRADVVDGLDRLAAVPSPFGLPQETNDLLRKQQLEWFDSGAPSALFHERFDQLTRAEGAAILAFLTAFREAHGEDFPFGELDVAIDRHWSRYG